MIKFTDLCLSTGHQLERIIYIDDQGNLCIEYDKFVYRECPGCIKYDEKKYKLLKSLYAFFGEKNLENSDIELNFKKYINSNNIINAIIHANNDIKNHQNKIKAFKEDNVINQTLNINNHYESGDDVFVLNPIYFNLTKYKFHKKGNDNLGDSTIQVYSQEYPSNKFSIHDYVSGHNKEEVTLKYYNKLIDWENEYINDYKALNNVFRNIIKYTKIIKNL